MSFDEVDEDGLAFERGEHDRVVMLIGQLDCGQAIELIYERSSRPREPDDCRQ